MRDDSRIERFRNELAGLKTATTRRTTEQLLLGLSVVLMVAGIVIGLAGAAALTRLMQAVLFGVTPLDPVAFVVAPAILLIVATAACLVPAKRAAAVDPAEALRAE